MTERIHSLDLLRGLAAFGVAIPHFLLIAYPDSFMLEATAVVGVEIFFVLSGYVLAPQILMCLKSPALFPTFLIRRWMRTIPPYWLALIVMALIAGSLGSADFLRYAIYVQNLYHQANYADFFGVAWSLSVEEWFYLVFPPVIFLLGRSRPVWATIAFIVAASLIRTIFGNYDEWGSEVRRVVLFRVDAIAYGFLLYCVLKSIPWWMASTVVMIGSASASYAVLWWISAGGDALPKIVFPFTAACFGCSAICLALSIDEAYSKSRWRVLMAQFLGQISYSVYLFHSAIFVFVGVAFPLLRFAPKIALVILCTALFAAAFYRWFEAPILRARPRYRSSTPFMARA